MEFNFVFWLVVLPVVILISFFVTKLIERSHNRLFSSEFNFKMAFMDVSCGLTAIFILAALRLVDPSLVDISLFGSIAIICYIITSRVCKWGEMI